MGFNSAFKGLNVRNAKQEFLQRHRGPVDNCQSWKERL